jgi:outer membrane protein assembly factor BamE (lipoprotein component of BamABCDE complex)
MRFRLRTLLILVAIVPPILALPFACPTISEQASSGIEEGMTKEEVLAVAGRPVNRYPSGDGGEVWEYHLAKFQPTAFLTPLCVRFDASGIVQAVWL